MTQAASSEQLELLRLLEEQHRQRARDDLSHYCRYIEIPGVPVNDDDDCEQFYPDNVTPADHHELLNSKLMELADPGSGMDILLVFMPPGSAKSTYGTVIFPTWYMGRFPDEPVICASYGDTLAKKFGRKCRQIVSSVAYQRLFAATLNSDNRAADDWSLTNGSTYMAGGILSGMTGNRAKLLVIDDPVKGREAADSPTIRQKTWDAYQDDLATRLKPGGKQLIIQTRWHEDDLAGRILPETWDGETGWVRSRTGDRVYVLCLEAECTRTDDPLGRKIGEFLWTDWFPVSRWQSEKAKGERRWASLYQQRPKPSEGALIKRAWPRRYRTPPAAFSRIVLSCDTAYKPEQINDPSVIGVWGELNVGHYLLHVWRDRVEYPELKRVLVNLANQWHPHAVLIEDKASGQSLIQECRAKTKLPVIAIDTEGQNKAVRLIEVSPQFESGRVWLPEEAPWLIDYESELFGFPLATHDDQVDMTSQYLKWASRNSGIIVHESTGTTRAGLSANESRDDNDDLDYLHSENDFGGFI